MARSGTGGWNAGLTLAAVRFTSKLNGAVIYRETFLTLGSTGDGLSLTFQTTDETALQTMERGIAVYSVQ